MKIMAIADHESKLLWDYFDKSYLEGIDLILSCGDLHPHYLSFLATFTHAPVLYVHGNHDDKYEKIPPDGCICIEDSIYVHNGVRILGLGGSVRYKPGINQYTQKEMYKRARKMSRKIKRNKGFDILLTHAPAYKHNDGEDLPHRGFDAFRNLLDEYKPAFFVHGHVHLNYGRKFPRESTYNETQVINAYEKYVFEIEDPVQSSEDESRKKIWFIPIKRKKYV